MLGGLCLDSCCGDIAYDGPTWEPFHSVVFPDKQPLPHVGANISKLTSNIKLMFAGNNNVCSNAMRYLPEDIWPDIREWLSNGGRLWLQTEYQGCLASSETVDNFLTAMGVTMHRLGGVIFNGESCLVGTSPLLADCLAAAPFYPNGSPIAADSVFRIALSEEISGIDGAGSPIWLAQGSGKCVSAVEQVGPINGFLFLTGDSNGSDCWAVYNRDFYRKLLIQPDDQIVA